MDQDKSLLAAEFIKQARAFLMQRRFDLAEDNATKAVELDPTQAMGFLVRAESRRMQQKHDVALADAAEVIRRDPDRAAPYVIRAEIMKRRLQFRQAIDQATKALRLDPNNAAAYANRAECLRCLGDLAAAAEDERELFRIDPTRYTAPIRLPGPLPAAGSSPVANENPTRRRPPGAYDDIFADGITPDRSLKSKVLMDADEAAELLAAASGYRPGLEQLRRPGKNLSGKGSKSPLLLAFMLGGLVIGAVGYMLTGTPRPGVGKGAKPAKKEIVVPVLVRDAPAPIEGGLQPRVEVQPEARKIVRYAPEIVRLDELNTKGWDGDPWLSRDGLRIYWVSSPPGGGRLGIWTATRKDHSSRFEGRKWLCHGLCPTVREDELQMYFIDRRPKGSKGNSIFVTRRSSKDSAFDDPREVPEFRSLPDVWGPSLSGDGLRLCFTRGNPQAGRVEVVEAARTTTDSAWDKPTVIPVIGLERLDGDLEYPSLSNDGLRLFCCLDKVAGGKQETRLMVWTRESTNFSFSRHQFISIPGSGEIEGWCPRLNESSGSLIYASRSRDAGDRVNLSSIKHFGEYAGGREHR